MKHIAIVDLSWLMHRYRHANADLSIYRNGQRVPTGHVYGTYKFIKDLSENYKRVILCVDSKPTIRKEILSSYKSNRHKETGNPYEDYDIHQDLDNILKLSTAIDNVYYTKKDGYEADDIIASYIKIANNEWDFYFHDDDILQTKGSYNLCVSYDQQPKTGSPIDRREHLDKKYDLFRFDYLPMIWKIIKGDNGDCIPIGLLRFPTKDLIQICHENKITTESSFEEIISALKNHKYSSKTWIERIGNLKEGTEDYNNLELNYNLVRPYFITDLTRNKFLCDNLEEVFKYYQIRPF